MKYMNEQIDGMVKSINEASQMKGVQWNRVTWTSWWLAVFLFVVVFPLLAFYIGSQYGKTMDIISSTNKEILISTFQAQIKKHSLSSTTLPMNLPKGTTSTPSATTTPDATEQYCGGFIKDAPTCPAKYHCVLKPVADQGGSCVRD